MSSDADVRMCIAAPETDERPVSPTDPMSFPPGLIPELVRQKLETDPAYSPLSTLDVDRAGLPEPSQPDAYLRARLDKFHAELKVSARLQSAHVSTFQSPRPRSAVAWPSYNQDSRPFAHGRGVEGGGEVCMGAVVYLQL